MPHRLSATAILLLVSSAASAQQPIPLLPPPPSFEQQPPPPFPPGPPGSPALPPVASPGIAEPAGPAPTAAPPPSTTSGMPEPAGPAPGASAQPLAPPAAPGRIFCGQTVPTRVADSASVPESYRPFIGIWSDAAWTPQLCAALIVESVTGDGTATITYAFGPIGSGNRAPGGVLHGTGVVRDGELRFQNNDGSQYAFKPLYADLQGRLTTPQGQSYETVFKKTY